MHDAIGARELIRKQDIADALYDSKRIGEVRRSRNPRLVALGFRIIRRPAGTVLFAPGQCLWQIRNVAAFDNAAAGRNCANCAKLPEVRQSFGRMAFQVPVGRSDRLPDAVEVGFPFDSSGLRRRLSRRQGRESSQHNGRRQQVPIRPAIHLISPLAQCSCPVFSPDNN